ncbi:MAG: hypothetical protein ACOY0T_04195 [Myxococcota bacterium]
MSAARARISRRSVHADRLIRKCIPRRAADSGWKIDFILRKSRSFSVEEFERRQQADLLGTRLFVASAEDVIVSKLEWAKLGESERQIRDVAGILKTKSDALDYRYIERWVISLGLENQWTTAKEEAGLVQV